MGHTVDKNSVCAVVVTYNAGSSIRQQFSALRHQVGRVVIVDNGSAADDRLTLRELQAGSPDKVAVILNGTNLGVGAAQNMGIRKAMNEGFAWVLLLDHDSVPEGDMVARMLEAYGNLPEQVREVTAVVAPQVVDRNALLGSKFTILHRKWLFRRVPCTAGKVLDVLTVIASGSMIRVDALNRLGGMREDYFIDYIDAEFSLRVHTAGFKIMVACDAVLHHALGQRKTYRIAGFTMKPSFHSAERRYFIFRNRIWVLKAYGLRVPSFVLLDLVLICYDILNILLFEDGKAEKFKMIGKGLIAGLGSSQGRG
jgi:rhamnosyltransferase